MTAPTAQAHDFGLGDVISDLIASASTAELGTQGVDQAFAAASSAYTLSAEGLFQQDIYDPLHAGVENWINSPFGEQVDNVINTTSGEFLIGNGAPGTEQDPTAGAGGTWFGDGGNGWDSNDAGVAGGSGGDAGIFGNGGEGELAATVPTAVTVRLQRRRERRHRHREPCRNLARMVVGPVGR
jgi:hypothetical protein